MGVAALLASPASAALHQVTLTGTLVSQMAPGSDPNLSVGSLFTLNATIDMSRAVQWGGYGFSVAPPESFSITSGNLTWIASDDVLDGFPLYNYDYFVYQPDGTLVTDHREIGRPMIAFLNGKVVGLSGDLLPAGNSDRPELLLGSEFYGEELVFNVGPGEPVQYQASFGATVGSTFQVLAPNGLYDNEYETPGFAGTWDFAGSSVQAAAIPEPASWALMILGMGAVGTLLRRRGAAALTMAAMAATAA
jgi:hypothetical protein